MKTKIVNKAVLLASLIVLSMTNAFAGEKGGNGGGAFICKNPTQSEFLDLFEARLSAQSGGLGLQVPSSNDPVDAQIRNAFHKLNTGSGLYAKAMNVYAEVRAAKINKTDATAAIAWPSDEKNDLNMKGCDRLGIMLYNDSNNSILQDEASLSSLPPTQQAAAWVHETIYKLLRETQGDTDSIRARKIVGHLFSGESQDQVDKALRKIDYTLMAVENDKVFATLSTMAVDLHLSVSQRMYVNIQEADPKCAGNEAMVTYLGNDYKGKTGEDIAIDVNPYAGLDNMIVSSEACQGTAVPYATVYIKGSLSDSHPTAVLYLSHETSSGNPILGGSAVGIVPVRGSSW